MNDWITSIDPSRVNQERSILVEAATRQTWLAALIIASFCCRSANDEQVSPVSGATPAVARISFQAKMLRKYSTDLSPDSDCVDALN